MGSYSVKIVLLGSLVVSSNRRYIAQSVVIIGNIIFT